MDNLIYFRAPARLRKLAWPAIIAATVIGLDAWLVFGALPKLLETYAQMHMALPFSPKTIANLMALAHHPIKSVPYIVGTSAVSYLASWTIFVKLPRKRIASMSDKAEA